MQICFKFQVADVKEQIGSQGLGSRGDEQGKRFVQRS